MTIVDSCCFFLLIKLRANGVDIVGEGEPSRSYLK